MGTRNKIRGSISVDIDLDDIVFQLDDDVVEELARSIDFVPAREVSGRDDAIVAINQIRAGKPDDAIITLERAFLPAWEDSAACEARYREVMGRAA